MKTTPVSETMWFKKTGILAHVQYSSQNNCYTQSLKASKFDFIFNV